MEIKVIEEWKMGKWEGKWRQKRRMFTCDEWKKQLEIQRGRLGLIRKKMINRNYEERYIKQQPVRQKKKGEGGSE